LLPVSGIQLAVREPTGEDELYVVETGLAPLTALLELVGRVATAAKGDPVNWAAVPAADLEAAALIIRQRWIGDAIRADIRCPGPECRERIDVSFGIDAYLGHHRPRRPRSVAEPPASGWYTLTGAAIRFRIPTIADRLAAADASHPADTLCERCVEAPEISRALARRLDRALSALAPSLNDLIGGSCPACGQGVTMRFDPLGYTLAELRNAFSGIHLETHALASEYGWPEEAILALPRSRRRSYASIIADERSVA
jgi:hypothetical protein